MKILFIGGTGVISTACSKLCIEKGHELSVLNRGQTSKPVPPEVKRITADIHNTEYVKNLLKNEYFDSIVNWISFTQSDVERDFSLFRDRTDQYIFISSASAYAKPPMVPLKESHPVDNPFWTYSQNKVHCENFLKDVAESSGFPVTIVRPSHTYDETKIPLQGGYTALKRMMDGKPVVVHGDGTSLWTLTHSVDFAHGFMGILGNKAALGEAYHITGDEVLTWDQIYQTMAEAAGMDPILVHVPSDIIHKHDKDWGDGLLGDKAYSLVFDNSKIKQFVPDLKTTIPFKLGARQMIEWYRANPAPADFNNNIDHLMDMLIEQFG